MMALIPIDERHAVQIQAGILGRNTGHKFEDTITKRINEFAYPINISVPSTGHVFCGDPAKLLIRYVAASLGIKKLERASAISTGALATSEEGKRWLTVNGANVFRCKSDLVLTLRAGQTREVTVGISTKQCNNKQPTNAQLYFTTARGFANLLQANGISVSNTALCALRQFCGDSGFRPADSPAKMRSRVTDPRRFFWEEISAKGRREWAACFADHQNEISRLLFQKAYIDDQFIPDFLIHKTKERRRGNHRRSQSIRLTNSSHSAGRTKDSRPANTQFERAATKTRRALNISLPDSESYRCSAADRSSTLNNYSST